MSWDSTRPVPWERLLKEWLFYLLIMLGIVLLFLRDRPLTGIFLGLLVSGPLYLGFGYVLAKFGYSRKSLKQMRSEAPSKGGGGRSGSGSSDSSSAGAEATPRSKPAPTRRTNAGARTPGSKGRRR